MARAAAALLLAGCTLVTGEVRPGDYVSARFRFTWSSADAVTGATKSCVLAGGDAARVTYLNLDTGDRFVDFFDCEKEGGLSSGITAGHYRVTPELVACKGDAECPDPQVIAATQGPLSAAVFEEGEHDLGHFVFEIAPGGP